VDETPQSSQAWKTWLGQTDRSALEQKVEKVYNKNMKQQEAPPIKRESKVRGAAAFFFRQSNNHLYLIH